MKRNQIVDVELYYLRESASGAAILVTNNERKKDALGFERRVDKWLPKSLIEYDLDKDVGSVIVTMPYWLCEQEGFENDIVET